MHVVLYHDAIIPPPKYGGTERVLYWLARALASRSHQVTLIAREGSEIEAPLPNLQVIGLPSHEIAHWKHHIPASTDILHIQGTPRANHGLPRPFLVTIHGNGQPGEEFHPNTVFVSRSHAQNHDSEHFVYNGIDPSEYLMESSREDYLVFLAKASWGVKNLKGAIDIAHQANRKLVVMGSRDWPFGLRRPSLGGVEYLGMVGNTIKRKILSRASGLLFPVRWNEPFGLAVVEALASGCPVFGTPYGSLPELLSDDCGFLSASAKEHVTAIRSLTFSANMCRARVLENFTHKKMAENYLRYYERVLNEGTLTTKAPRSISMLAQSRDLLPWLA